MRLLLCVLLGLVVLGYGAVTTRYVVTMGTSGAVVRLDRWTGAVAYCFGDNCARLNVDTRMTTLR